MDRTSTSENAWDSHRYRSIDTSLRTLLAQLLRALAGLTVAYLGSRWISDVLLGLGTGLLALGEAAAVHVLLAGCALYLTSARPIRRDLGAQRHAVAASQDAMANRVAEESFLRDVSNALDMGETEADALAVTAAALAQASPGPAELLVADASRAHLRRAATADGRDPPGCGVETPWGCPAVRRGQVLRFESSSALAACPRLRDRGSQAVAAVCVPITILGTPTAVIHATRPAGGVRWDDETVDRLGGIGVQIGARIGVLRAMAKSELQAQTDPLTGLLNRRAMEERVGELRTAGTPFAVAMADLDRFKHLNDSFGHDTGDRALGTFSRVIREAVRDSDIVGRHGGEEFVVVLPHVDALGAAPILHRIREQLQGAVGTALIPTFTVSIGVADSTWSSDFAEVLRAADHALFEAKSQGRDRLVIADLPPGADLTASFVGHHPEPLEPSFIRIGDPRDTTDVRPKVP